MFAYVIYKQHIIEPVVGVYKPVIMQPLQKDVVVVELCVMICLFWAGPLMTGLDIPIEVPSATDRYDTVRGLAAGATGSTK